MVSTAFVWAPLNGSAAFGWALLRRLAPQIDKTAKYFNIWVLECLITKIRLVYLAIVLGWLFTEFVFYVLRPDEFRRTVG
jgi:hypothetical protein